MNLKPVRIEMDIQDDQRVLAISMDEDKDAALAFIRERLAKHIEKKLQKQ
ncbi:MAG: hypothetical protein U9P10_02285 [Thermodesulfobacteriota bacterium]|nr:hypothetical protein [Thermodesulfobacteriota bacterium]